MTTDPSPRAGVAAAGAAPPAPGIYRVTSGRYLRSTVTRSLRALAALLAATFAALLAVTVALADLRWLILAFMLVLVVAPMAVAPWCLWQMARPGLAMRVGLFSVEYPSRAGGSIVLRKYAEPAPGEPVDPRPVAEERIPAADVAGASKAGDGLLMLRFAPAGRRLPLIVPDEGVRDHGSGIS